jgi:threonyl-tRNA synthetase
MAAGAAAADLLGEKITSSDFLSRMRHTTAHVLAQAVKEIFPDAKLGIGPVIEDGFYYDFDLPRPLTPDDLPALEERMARIVGENLPLTRFAEERAVARARCEAMGQPYKVELVEGLPEGEEISFYRQGDFVDLCRGPHVEATGRIGAFKLLSIAGAYWRGKETNPQLTRIYGTAWQKKSQLAAYLERLEEAKRRDHRVLGKQLGFFANTAEVGLGLPLWLPNGAAVRQTLENYIAERERIAGYEHVYTPDIAKVDLYKQSGHWAHYKDSMFPVMKTDHEEFVLRPMNCPHHIQIYKNDRHSYRELPIRLAELGTMYRYEKSGELAGLSRVRAMTLSDAHIFCREDQVKDEVKRSILLIEDAYRTLGITQYRYRLSLHDPADKEKYIDDPALWEKAETELREVFGELGLPFFEGVGEAAFYGPKVDIQLANVLGHEESVSTVQVDRHLPRQFDLEYIGEDSRPHRPVMIHRGYLSTMERMIAFLIEHYAGAFPTWLAPEQVRLLPIADRHAPWCDALKRRLVAGGFRAGVDARSEKTGKKVAEAQVAKVPYMLVVGDRDIAAASVSVRHRERGDLGPRPVEQFLADLKAEVEGRLLAPAAAAPADAPR